MNRVVHAEQNSEAQHCTSVRVSVQSVSNSHSLQLFNIGNCQEIRFLLWSGCKHMSSLFNPGDLHTTGVASIVTYSRSGISGKGKWRFKAPVEAKTFPFKHLLTIEKVQHWIFLKIHTFIVTVSRFMLQKQSLLKV